MVIDHDKLTAEVEADFARMARDLEHSNPGVNELLRAYGEYESTVRQLEIYLGLLRPKPVYLTTNATTIPGK